MIVKREISIVLVLLISVASGDYVAADTFGTDPNTTFDIEFVTIGNPGNPADPVGTGSTNPAGSVPYEYRIGKFEISEDMIDKANAQSLAHGDPLGITKDTRGPNKPATSVNWFEAAKLVNWLNTSTGHTPAYKFDGNGTVQSWDPNDLGYNPNNPTRNSQTRYVLLTNNEWYKAAYYDPNSSVYHNYPTGSDTAPTPVASGTAAGTAVISSGLPYLEEPADITLAGGLSRYGVMAQGGNVYEWQETGVPTPEIGVRRFNRGGSFMSTFVQSAKTWFRSASPPLIEREDIGFRVASIPEPTTSALALAALCLAMSRRRAF